MQGVGNSRDLVRFRKRPGDRGQGNGEPEEGDECAGFGLHGFGVVLFGWERIARSVSPSA